MRKTNKPRGESGCCRRVNTIATLGGEHNSRPVTLHSHFGAHGGGGASQSRVGGELGGARGLERVRFYERVLALSDLDLEVRSVPNGTFPLSTYALRPHS